MGKRVELEIKESLSDLKKLRRNQTTLQKQKRAHALVCLKECKFATRQGLADHLGIHIRSLEKWVLQYKESEIEDLLSIKARRKSSKIITPSIHAGLKERVYDSSNPFRGYWDAKQWVEEQYGVMVNYHRIREYLIQHFNTKVKQPRKSHIKKEAQAKEAFFKTTPYIQGT